ncbi:MAG TPA: hypothetical protein VM936_06170 [Pyrinomonadaceae bacterium]|jgi:hypothetical protein|nr:hypothetical protein [Pyrinomonadaceae bacterium]
MKVCLLSLALAFAAASAAPARAQGQSGGAASTTLTNASVVKLVRAGFREKTVIAIIAARPVNFDLTPERLIELKKGGVSERVILAMLARAEAVEFASDDWDDMPLDGDSGASRSPGGSSDPGSVNIFGSSGGAHGRTRSRSGNGGADNDTQTVGSASVRIVRPPAEGNAQSKLERTPTLTNDSVVELVEAGFSEGTIVRRIEQSPVEFDLSASKLAELRKRRVGEPVIAAMRAAMGEGQNEPARPEK